MSEHVGDCKSQLVLDSVEQGQLARNECLPLPCRQAPTEGRHGPASGLLSGTGRRAEHRAGGPAKSLNKCFEPVQEWKNGKEPSSPKPARSLWDHKC